MKNLKGKKVAVFGDSIMYGSGNGGRGVAEYVAEATGAECVKYCIGGARVGYREGKSWVVEQVKKAINENCTAQLIIFDGFTNDCNLSGGSSVPDVPLGEMTEGFDGFDIFAVKKENTQFSRCLEEVIAAFRKYFVGAKLLFVRPHKMGRRDAQLQKIYGERAVEICKKWGVAVADIYTDSDMDTFAPEQRDMYTGDTYGWGRGDATHPNAAGYTQKYMPLILEAINKI